MIELLRALYQSKGFDWATTDRLHWKGTIGDPVRKSKLLILTEEGLRRSEELFRTLFTQQKLVRDAALALKSIGQFIVEVNGHMGSIARSVKEQSTVLKEVNQAVNPIDQATQQNAAMIEQSTAASNAVPNKIHAMQDDGAAVKDVA